MFCMQKSTFWAFIPAILVCSTRASKKVDLSVFFGSCERFSSVGSSSKDMRILAYNAEMSMSPCRVDLAPACCLSRSETSVSLFLIVLVIVTVKVFLLRFTHYLQLSPAGYYGPGIAASHSTWMNDGGKTKERARNQKLLDLIFRSDHELLWPGSHPVLAYWFRTGSHRRFLRCLVILNIHN